MRGRELQPGKGFVPAWISLWGQKIFRCQTTISKLKSYVPLTSIHTPASSKSTLLPWPTQPLFSIGTYALFWYNQLIVVLRLYVCAFFYLQPRAWMWPTNCRVWSQLYSAFPQFHCYIYIINKPKLFSVIVTGKFPDESFSLYSTHPKCCLRHILVLSQTCSWPLLHLHQMIHLWVLDMNISEAELTWYPYLWCLDDDVIFKKQLIKTLQIWCPRTLQPFNTILSEQKCFKVRTNVIWADFKGSLRHQSTPKWPKYKWKSEPPSQR